MARFQIVYGNREQPKEEWVPFTFYDGPKAVKEWDNPQAANAIVKDYNNRMKASGSSIAFMLSRLPDPVDYLLRETSRANYLPFEHQGAEYHCAEYDDGNITFYNTLNDAYDDKRTKMRLGRYLTTYVSSLSAVTVSAVCARYGVEAGDLTIRWARTRDEIVHVYSRGPSSCMRGDRSDYFGHAHPAEAYASPDLAIAYLERDDRITARTVVNMNTKEFVGIYGDAARLEPLLNAEGYTRNYTCLVGARLLKILVRDNDSYAVPYLDSDCCVKSLDAEYLICNSDSIGAWSGECGYVYVSSTERESGDVGAPDPDDYDDYGYDDY